MDQTEQAQAKPRRRRRWLIIALLLVLVGGAAWWEWPRGDARFVGRWRVLDWRNGQEQDVGEMALYSNGSVGWNCFSVYFKPVEWSIESDRLVVRDVITAMPSGAQSCLQWIRQNVVALPNGGRLECSVLRVGPDEIELESSPTTRVILKRLPE